MLLSGYCANSQTFSALGFEDVAKKKSTEDKVDSFNSEGFVKTGNNPIRLIKKKLDKKSQTTFEEVIVIKGDTTIYSFNNPKMYAEFKDRVDEYYKKREQNGQIVYTVGKRTYILTESEETGSDGEKHMYYNFKFFKRD